MRFPISTGQAAKELTVTEPRLNDLIRRGKIPAPPVLAGRRLWNREHIRQAATYLGRPTPEAIQALEDGGGDRA